MTASNATRLAALLVLLPAAAATGCNAHPLVEVEYVSGGGIELDDEGGADADAGDDDGEGEGDDEGGDGEGDGEDNDGDDGDDAGDDDGDDGEDASLCTTEVIDVSANPPQVMLVLDKSTSMVDNSWDHNGDDVLRWESLHSVVTDVVGTYDNSMDFGAVFFPALDATGPSGGAANSCRMADAADVSPAPGNATAILATMPGATDTDAVRGRTPAREGIELATASLAATETQGARAMILVTDGLANCVSDDEPSLYDQAMPGALAAAADQQIPTYVVGIDIRDEFVSYAQANARTELDTVARAGGVPASDDLAYYDASDEDALYDALDEIAARVECTIPLADAAPADAVVTIAVDGSDVEEITDCSTQDGWHFTDAQARNTVELCGAACDALRVTGVVETTSCSPDDEGVGEPTPLPVP